MDKEHYINSEINIQLFAFI